MNKWILVTERTPEVGKLVLISTKERSVPQIGYLDTFCKGCADEYNVWITTEWGYVVKDVTAWMELPKPYKEGEK